VDYHLILPKMEMNYYEVRVYLVGYFCELERLRKYCDQDTECSIQNANLTTTVFANYGDINIIPYFFSFYLLGRTCRTASHLSTLPDAGYVSCRRNFPCPEILLPVVYCLIWYFLVRIRIAKCLSNNASRTATNDFYEK
jgi:hypothetical protein